MLNEILSIFQSANQNLTEVIYSNSEVKKYFFEEFVGGITKRIYLNIIAEIVMVLCDLCLQEIKNDNSDMADAMRCIFDQSQPLYQRYFQKEQQHISFNDSSIMTQFSDEEREWRMQLSQGSQIDAIKIDPEYGIQCWAKAKIVQCLGDGSYFKVEFENDSSKFNRDFTRYSLEITEYNTMSQGDEWRQELKAGDLLDAFDSTKVWYGSTIQDREIRIEEGREILFLKVGFRLFHPQGNKLDDNKQPFFGWSERFDEWLTAYHPRLQQFQSFAKNWEQQLPQASNLSQDDTIDDNIDQLLYSKCLLKPVYALARKRCQSTLLVAFLNKFGESGGFNLIIEKIKERGESSMGLDTLFYYLDCLSNCSIMLNKFFLKEYLPVLDHEVKQKILTATEQQLRNIKKDRIDCIASCLYGNLFSRITNYKMIQQVKDLFNFQIGVVFLEQNFLEKRIDGAKLIQDVCKSLNMSMFQASTETVYNNSSKQQQFSFIADIIQTIKAKQVLYQIFSKERGHLQLVQRTEALLKLLIGQNALDDEEFELIWRATKIDEHTKLELYKVLNEISSRLRKSDVTFIIEQLNSKKLNEIINEEIELVHELAKHSRRTEASQNDLAIQYLWKIAFQNDQADNQLVNQAALALIDIIKNWENEHKLTFVEKLVQNLQNNSEGYLSIKMLIRILKDFSGSPQKKPEPEIMVQEDSEKMDVDNQKDRFESKSTFIDYIVQRYNLLEAFFSNFKDYLNNALTSVQQKLNDNPNLEVNTLSDKCLCDKFIHSDQISERLEFLKYLCCNGSAKINKEQLNFIHEYLVLKSPLQGDSEMFYRWLREICDILSQHDCFINLADIIQFFKEIEQNSNITYKNMTNEGFNCMQSFVMLLNESSGFIIKSNGGILNNQPVQKFTSISNNNGKVYNSYTFNQSKGNQTDSDELEFQVQVNPLQLEGLQSLWHIAIESNDKQVFDKSCQLLIKLFTCVSQQLESQVSHFEDNFIENCMNGIIEQIKIIQQRNDQEKEEMIKVQKSITAYTSTTVIQKMLPIEERKILKYLNMIKELIRNSEKDGTRDIKPHSALFKGELLQNITVANSLKQGVKYLNKIEIPCYSNTTIWELKQMIGERIARQYNQDGTFIQEAPCHPATIRLYRFAGCIDIKDIDNGKTLAEMKFKPNEALTAYKKTILTQNRAPLLTPDKSQLTDQAKAIFIEWFNIFSEEDPDNPGVRVMTPKTCAYFTRSCTDDFCTEEDSRVVGFFVMYDDDKDGKILQEDFLRFYLKSCQEKEDVVRHNLLAHNYKYDLKKFPIDGSDPNIMQIRFQKDDMPRYKLANNQQWFDTLINLLQQQGEVSNQTWNIISMLTTNPTLYQKVLELQSNPSFSWEAIFDQTNIYKMLYTLQIIESLLEENSKDDQLKQDWIERFLLADGFSQILKLFHNALDQLSGKQVDNLNKFEKNFLEYMLKMIRIFMMAAFTTTDSGIQDVITLVRKGSSMNEKSNKQDQSMQTQNNQENFQTPSKQVKGKFVQQKRAQINGYLPEINQDFLFGETQDNSQIQVQPQQSNKDNEENKIMQQDSDLRQLEDNQKFSELSAIIRNSGLGEFILHQIDYKDLQIQILEVICLILGKKEISVEDKQIIENALSLWLATLIRNQDLIDEFYNFKRTEEKAGMFGIKNAEQLLLAGLYCYKNSRVRDEFCNTIICISQKVQKNNGGQLFLMYALNICKNNLPKEDQYYATRECQQFFELLIQLLEEYFKLPKEHNHQDNIDNFSLLKEIIERLKRYESKEKKNTVLEDMTLIGYLNLIGKLITHLAQVNKKELLHLLDETSFIDELFYGHLFLNSNLSHVKNGNKCKTKESRKVAFYVLQKYMEVLEPKELTDYLENYIWPLISNVERPKKWKYTASENQKTSNFTGLINLGFICYMNSMLQQFFMVPQFRYQLLKAIDNSPQDLVDYKGLQIDDNLLRQLQKMFGSLELSERHAYDPTEFCFAFKDFEGNPTNIGIQQDTHEFINMLFDRIEELLKPTCQKHLLEGIFGGKLCQQLICSSCGNIRNRLENFFNLSLPVKDRKGIEDSLSKMIESQLINDYFCDICQKKVDVTKRGFIGETPNVLIVHLQRLIFNFDIFQNEKINTRFEFPSILNLKNYSFKSVMQKEGRDQECMQDEEVKHLMDIEDDEYIYKLVGVTIHSGTAEQGHYYSIINTKRGNEEVDENSQEWQQTEKDPWKTFDDDKITPYLFSELKMDCFGGNANNINDKEMDAYLASTGNTSYGKNAYILVYERKKKAPLYEIVSDNAENIQMQTEQATLDCVDTATSRAVEDQTTSFVDSKNNDLKQHDGISMIPYKQVKPYIPEWIQTTIKEDNAVYLKDRLIYHESFFNMLKSIFKHISNNVLYTQHQYNYEYVKHFLRLKNVTLDIARKSMFDLLAYYYYNIQMSDITNYLGSIIQFCDSHVSLCRGDDSILLKFINEAYLNDNCQYFFNIMFTCPDKTSRYYIGKLTSMVINKVYQIYQEAENKDSQKLIELKEAADKFIYIVVKTLSTSECQKNWSKLENYLKMIYEIGTGGYYQSHYLLTKFDIIVDMIDFMLGNKSPLAVQRREKRPNMDNDPPFQSLIDLICYLIRFTMTSEMKQEEPFWDNELNQQPSTLMGYNIESDQGNEEKYPLSPTTLLFFSETDFISKVLKDGYECIELGKALAHFCYKNLKFSKKIALLLLKGVSNNDFDKVKNYLDVVTQVAMLKDQYQRIRLEWIFGFGQLQFQVPFNQQFNEKLTQLGISNLNYLHDEVYVLKSSLLSDSNDDSLLHLLWRYKGRMDSYTVNCLYYLINLIASNDSVAQYFSEIPGPTYCLARYTDWIKPYLFDQLLDARKGYSGSQSAAKEELIVKILSLYQKYEQFLSTKDNLSHQQQQFEMPFVYQTEKMEIEQQQDEEVEENVKNLITQSETKQQIQITSFLAPNKQDNEENPDQQCIIHCQPQPYIIIECVRENYVKELHYDGVTLSISSLSCFYTMSKPTGKSNQSIPQNLFKKSSRQYNYSKVNTNNNANREQELQTNCITNYFQSSANKEPQSHVPLKQQVIFDNDEQWRVNQDHMNVSDIENEEDEEEEHYDRDQEQEFNQYNEKQYQENNVYQIKVVEERQESAQEPEFKDVQTQNNCQEGEVNRSQEEKEQNDSETIQWPDEVNFCKDLVYKLDVKNHTSDTIKITLKFIEKDGDYINLQWPRSGIKTSLFGNQIKSIMLLPKIQPNENQEMDSEIDKLHIDFKWREKFPMNKSQANQHRSNQPQIQVEKQEEAIQKNSEDQVPIGVNEENVQSAPQGLKSCPRCTFFNDQKAVMCDCCEFIF